MKNFQSIFTLTLLGILLLLPNSSTKITAQNNTDTDQWEFLAEVYMMFPYMNGETGIGNNVILPVESNPGDIFSNLKMAGMLYFEAKNTQWAITTDLIYVDLNQDVTPGTVIVEGELEARQFIWETAGLYRVLPYLEVGIGGRLNNISIEADITKKSFPRDTEESYSSGAEIWFDPFIVTRLTKEIDDKWLFQFRGDLGGFGVGSDFSWQAQAYAGYKFSELFQLTAGYRILSMDYDKGSDTERFIYDMNLSGPVIKLGFNF